MSTQNIAQENIVETVIETVTSDKETVKKAKSKKAKENKISDFVEIIIRFMVKLKKDKEAKPRTISFKVDMLSKLENQISKGIDKMCEHLHPSLDVSIMIDGCTYPFTNGFKSNSFEILVEEAAAATSMALVAHYGNTNGKLTNQRVLELLGVKNPITKVQALDFGQLKVRVADKSNEYYRAADKLIIDELAVVMLPDTHRGVHYKRLEVKKKEKDQKAAQKKLASGK